MVFVFKGKEKDIVVILVTLLLMDLTQRFGAIGNYYSGPKLKEPGHWGIFTSGVYRFVLREILVYLNLGISILCMSYIKFNKWGKGLYLKLIISLDFIFLGIAAVRFLILDTKQLESAYTFMYSGIVSTWLFVIFILFHFTEQNLDRE